MQHQQSENTLVSSQKAHSASKNNPNTDDAASVSTSTTSSTGSPSSLPEELREHLSARLETGLDQTPKLDEDPFIRSVKKEKAFIVTRKYTQDATQVQPVLQEMLNQPTPEEQLVVLKQLMDEKDKGDSLWIHIMGVEEKVINGLSDLCGLSTGTMTTAIQRSEHRHHRSHIEIHADYTYIQLLVQQCPKIRMETPIYDMVRHGFTPSSVNAADIHKGTRRSEDELDCEADIVRVGFISIFIIPKLNVLVTVSLPYYDCPASRLVIHTAKMDATEHCQLILATDVTLLGLSMVHRTVGYASGVIRQADHNISKWSREVENDLSVERLNDIRTLITEIQCFQSRLKPLLRVHQKAKPRLGEQRHSQPNDWWIAAQEVVDEGCERLEDVIDDVDRLVERCRALEEYSFNMMSTRANDSMERLAIVTIVFLPLTFIASYFSMGFEEFPDLSRPPIYFWEISVPLSVMFFFIFAFSNLKRGYNVLSKYSRQLQKRGEKEWYWAKKDVELWWRLNRRKYSYAPSSSRQSGGRRGVV